MRKFRGKKARHNQENVSEIDFVNEKDNKNPEEIFSTRLRKRRWMFLPSLLMKVLALVIVLFMVSSSTFMDVVNNSNFLDIEPEDGESKDRGTRAAPPSTDPSVTANWIGFVPISNDSLSRLTVAEGPWGSSNRIEYIYDSMGNREELLEDGIQAKDYIYTTYNRLLQIIGPGTDISYTYDNNGNMITKTESGSTIQFTYDSENMLRSAIGDGCDFRDATYDALNRRIYYFEGDTFSTTGYLGDQSAYETMIQRDGTTVEYLYGYLNGMKIFHIAFDEENTYLSYYYYDQLGNVRLIYGEREGYLDISWFRADYKPFGEMYFGGGESKYKFTGELLDGETGLYYLRARYYDPEIGRFISQDPVSGFIDAPKSLNQYVYCFNNPLKFTDPTGEMPSGDDILTSLIPAYGMYKFVTGTYDWWTNRASDEEKAAFLTAILVAFIIGLAVFAAVPTGGASLGLLFIAMAMASCGAGITYVGLTKLGGGEPTMEGLQYSMSWGAVAGGLGFGLGQWVQIPTASSYTQGTQSSGGWTRHTAGSEGEGPLYQVGNRNGNLGNWWGRTQSPSTQSAKGFYGKFGDHNLANEMRVGYIKPGATYLERPMCGPRRIGLNTEIFVRQSNVYMINVFPIPFI